MRLFGPRKPPSRLAKAAAIGFFGPAASWLGRPPGFDGEPGPFSLVAIHGAPRPRRWDTVASAHAPALTGTAVHFVTLPDGTVVVDEDEPDGSVTPLADAVEATVAPPYRAEAARHAGGVWSVAATRIAVVSAPGIQGEAAELTQTREGRQLTVDGEHRWSSIPAFAAVGEAKADDYVVRARRIDGELWEVEAAAL